MAGRAGSPSGLPVPRMPVRQPRFGPPPVWRREVDSVRILGVRTMATHAQPCKRLHAPVPPVFSLKLYRALRPFVGPVLAWRVAFDLRAAA